MSRYQVDKVLREVVLTDDAARAFHEDPAAYLEGRELTPEERSALVDFDYRALYAMGAHPFVLNGFVMRLWPGDRRSAQDTYRGAIGDLGYPDFRT